MEDDGYNWYDGNDDSFVGDYPDDDNGGLNNDWIDNGDGSLTDNDTGEIWNNETGEFMGWENEDGSWVDLLGFVWNEDNQIIGTVLSFDDSFAYDETLGVWYDLITGEFYNVDGELVTTELLRNPDAVAWVDELQAPAPGSGLWDGVKSFFGGLFGGGSGTNRGSNSGGGFGGGASGAAQQRAEQSQQKLQQAQQQGAPAQQIAALQQQLKIAQAAANAAGQSSGVNVQTLALLGGVAALAFFIGSRRR